MRYTTYCGCCVLIAGILLYRYVKHLERGYRTSLRH